MKKSNKESLLPKHNNRWHWLFFGLFVLSLTCGMYQLRQNNITALKLRDDVLAADKNNGDVEGALRSLRAFVYGHMNTNLSSGPNAIKPPIQLKYRYDRLVAAENKRVASLNVGTQKRAAAHCRSVIGSTRQQDGYQACLGSYMLAHGVKPVAIPDALYKFDFVSPAWSADLAGWSLLIAAVSFMLFVIGFVLQKWLRNNVRSQMA